MNSTTEKNHFLYEIQQLFTLEYSNLASEIHFLPFLHFSLVKTFSFPIILFILANPMCLRLSRLVCRPLGLVRQVRSFSSEGSHLSLPLQRSSLITFVFQLEGFEVHLGKGIVLYRF